jgi:hypothetical protein
MDSVPSPSASFWSTLSHRRQAFHSVVRHDFLATNGVQNKKDRVIEFVMVKHRLLLLIH